MSEDRSARADFPEFYGRRELRRWVPSISEEPAVPVSEVLTGDELTLTFDRPEFADALEETNCWECERQIAEGVDAIAIFRACATGMKIMGYSHAWHFETDGMDEETSDD
ncbi:hypothetical protein [Microbacterium sp. LWH11-1.2]|uniref:hypothetical protein n=1 Tax=Microbacterium sp. LWH11-1.2 TaxID=3135258 RepID=UPI003138ED1C